MKNTYIKAAIATLIFAIVFFLGQHFVKGEEVGFIQLVFSSGIFMAIMIAVFSLAERKK
jgi:hypothetical protein